MTEFNLAYLGLKLLLYIDVETMAESGISPFCIPRGSAQPTSGAVKPFTESGGKKRFKAIIKKYHTLFFFACKLLVNNTT